ncbi:hypothetical protein PSEUBRA_002415 [Kalmanozyma brasiliensis GHG001]|uniref:uncharacterized protein n=1 Tax=Kalmanozyma brasiliensis (strain GHG001) TaxID=1365824 RepID=UPI001CE72564|nr:uncharacterized protein PSEUBRA_002415 [Kalmanozyma brasiliensis GHG001]KAF6767084.1 hypothetical protein PSEUBRA_002415 [Kalmanozyma brasiliensis GHG001]
MAKKHASDVHLEEASTVPHLESLGQPTRELEHAYIEHLASLTEQPPPGGHREPFHIWAWLGNADARPAPLNEKMPLLLAPDDSVSESLVAESVAATLIHNGFARIADTPTSSGWLELDLSWLLHMEDSEFGVRKRRFTDQGSRFLIVPTKFMKQGISLGKTSMQRLNMRLVREDPGTTPHLEMGEFQGWHARLKCLSKDSHRNYATKPFERLCRLAEESYLYLERRRVSESDIDRNERGRRGAPDCYRPSRDRRTSQIAGSTTPPREERHYGQSAELLGPISGSEHSRREFSRLGDRAIRGVASDQDTREVEHHSVAPFPRTRHADTPHPSTTSTEQEARHFREQWERERERSTDRSTAARGADTVDLDYGSPLTRTTLAQVGAYEDDDDYSDEVDELADA